MHAYIHLVAAELMHAREDDESLARALKSNITAKALEGRESGESPLNTLVRRFVEILFCRLAFSIAACVLVHRGGEGQSGESPLKTLVRRFIEISFSFNTLVQRFVEILFSFKILIRRYVEFLFSFNTLVRRFVEILFCRRASCVLDCSMCDSA